MTLCYLNVMTLNYDLILVLETDPREESVPFIGFIARM